MNIPQVTFPLAQEDIKAKREAVVAHLRALNSEVELTQALLRAIASWCRHPNKCGGCCPDCGTDWND